MTEIIDISPGSLDSTCASSSPAFLMMYSAYKLNKQGANIQPDDSSLGDIPKLGTEFGSPALQADHLPSEPLG